MGTGNGNDFLRCRVGHKNLSLHFAFSPENGLPAYGIPDGKSNGTDLEDTCIGDLDVGINLAAEHAVAEHGFPVDVQGNDLGLNGNRDQVDHIIYGPDILLVVMEVIDIVHLVVICGLGCIEEQVVQDQRVGGIYVHGVVLNSVSAQVCPLFGISAGAKHHDGHQAE